MLDFKRLIDKLQAERSLSAEELRQLIDGYDDETLVYAAAAARADYENARREYERISALWADRLVTAAEHAAAEAAYRRAEAAYSRPAASGTANLRFQA